MGVAILALIEMTPAPFVRGRQSSSAQADITRKMVPNTGRASSKLEIILYV